MIQVCCSSIPQRVDIEKYSHAELFRPARIGRRSKAGFDGPFLNRRDNLRQPAQLENSHVRAALETVVLKKNPHSGFAQSAESRYAFFFSFQIFRVLLISRPRVKRAGRCGRAELASTSRRPLLGSLRKLADPGHLSGFLTSTAISGCVAATAGI